MRTGADTPPRPVAKGWATAGWGAMALYALYRLASLVAGYGDLPMGGCLMIEPLVIPALMAVCDGMLLAWVLVELRNAVPGEVGDDVLEPGEAATLAPAAILGCLLALPARYLATAAYCAGDVGGRAGGTSFGEAFRWLLLGPGLASLQGRGPAHRRPARRRALVPRHGAEAALAGYGRLVRAEGGHLVAALAGGGPPRPPRRGWPTRWSCRCRRSPGSSRRPTATPITPLCRSAWSCWRRWSNSASAPCPRPSRPRTSIRPDPRPIGGHPGVAGLGLFNRFQHRFA